ncbi:type II secretion system protein [Cerasicoccus frondis]|uniref:type II secretion system protein n=1 Tax=Cerasicoccus frondis TaxID=490090 RepID=UPI002852D3DE|nr:type II secretion system protein [Cerasicoccus frondis]
MRAPNRNRGFTLTELLVSISIIVLLAGILIPAVSITRRKSQQATALNNVRQIGMAIQMHTQDHNSVLPGPMNTGQGPEYRSTDEKSLGFHLWSYLNAPAPTTQTQRIEVLSNPANESYRQGENSPVYVLNGRVRVRDRNLNPWGYVRSSGEVVNASQNVNALLNDNNLTQLWALQDVDQQLTEFNGAGWYGALPEEPVHLDGRVTLFFDGHVDVVPVD